jgi:hypothetical protein
MDHLRRELGFSVYARGRWKRVCITVMCILVLMLVMCWSAGEATAVRGATTTSQYQVLQPRTLESVGPACQAPCECMGEGSAQAKWGTNGYIRCSQTSCGQAPTIAAVIPYYCFRKNDVIPVQRKDILVVTRPPVLISNPGQKGNTTSSLMPRERSCRIPGSMSRSLLLHIPQVRS